MRGKVNPATCGAHASPVGMRARLCAKHPAGMRHRVDIKLAQHRKH